MSINTLETERLNLRQFTTNDAAFILELMNEPAYIQNIGDRGIRSTLDAQRYIEAHFISSYARNGFGLYLVQLKESRTPIGMCGLIKREVLEDVDIGYAFLSKFWLKGYAVEAAQAVRDYGRDIVGLKRLVAITDPTNVGSIRVLQKIGMTFEKMVRLSADDIELKLFAMAL